MKSNRCVFKALKTTFTVRWIPEEMNPAFGKQETDNVRLHVNHSHDTEAIYREWSLSLVVGGPLHYSTVMCYSFTRR